MKIVFMGTPDFSVPCLKRLVSDGEEVVGVFTQPDKPKGRGYEMAFSPVKECAIKHNIPVFQPKSMKDGEALKIIETLNPDLTIVVAYGKILPKDILDYPKYGCVNIHGSLLPKYRGAAPIQRAVLDGESETGVTTMQMAEGLDTGDMLLVYKTLLCARLSVRPGLVCGVEEDERLAVDESWLNVCLCHGGLGLWVDLAVACHLVETAINLQCSGVLYHWDVLVISPAELDGW